MSNKMKANKARWAENSRKIDNARDERIKKSSDQNQNELDEQILQEQMEEAQRAAVASKEYLNLKVTGLKFDLNKGEKFKQCLGSTTLWVSNYGRLIRKYRDRYDLAVNKPDESRLKPYVRVSINGKLEYLHRLVAEVWCEGYTSVCNEVHHLDGNSLNNHCNNLKWVCKVHHAFLDRGSKLFFCNRYKNSVFHEITNLEETTRKMDIDLRTMSFILKQEPDIIQGATSIYEIDADGDLPYLIAVVRQPKKQAA